MCSGSLGPHPIAALLGFLAPAFVAASGLEVRPPALVLRTTDALEVDLMR